MTVNFLRPLSHFQRVIVWRRGGEFRVVGLENFIEFHKTNCSASM